MLNFAKTASLPAKLWQNAGFDLLLVENSARREHLKAEKIKVVSPSNYKVANTVQVPTQVANIPNVSANEKNVKQENEVVENKIISSPRTSEEAREQGELHTPFIKNIYKEYEWPAVWNALWERAIRHPNPKVAWTYTGLHADMLDGSTKSLQRQQLIGKFIKELHRPNGTHVFIPYDKCEEPGSALILEEKSFFWSAVARLNIKQILVFGSIARDELKIPARGQNSTVRGVNSTFFEHGYRICLLNDINRLIDANSDGKDVLAYINSQLSSVNL